MVVGVFFQEGFIEWGRWGEVLVEVLEGLGIGGVESGLVSFDRKGEWVGSSLLNECSTDGAFKGLEQACHISRLGREFKEEA